MQKPDAILIAGPTASGKSKYALKMAQQWGGEIINTDSMQIYQILSILTARPEKTDLQQIPHHLYGYVDVQLAYSVSRWLKDAGKKAEELWAKGVVPIFVGGTGLYFQALENGLADTPEIPFEVRNEIRNALLEHGSEKLHGRLKKLDPKGAAILRPTDGQRIARALEVVSVSGKPLAYFQALPVGTPLLRNKNCLRHVLMPERPILHQRINARSEQMLKAGAIEEVRELLSLNPDPDATVMRAIGVKQISDYIQGKQSLKECTEKIKAATRQYSKRQSTWFRGQFSDDWQFMVNKSL